MQLLDFADDSSDRAVAFALGTTDTAVVDLELEELAAGSGRTAFVADVCNVLILEVAECTQNGNLVFIILLL